jgi:serine/threonine protein kinase
VQVSKKQIPIFDSASLSLLKKEQATETLFSGYPPSSTLLSQERRLDQFVKNYCKDHRSLRVVNAERGLISMVVFREPKMIGQTILHYKVLEKLGEGGMGVVYKAEDTKLKRTVAIKFLPRQISSQGQERERFKIEAQAAAALNHPNIATIHAIEEVDDDLFIVMEYIDGQELKEQVASGKWQVASCK